MVRSCTKSLWSATVGRETFQSSRPVFLLYDGLVETEEGALGVGRVRSQAVGVRSQAEEGALGVGRRSKAEEGSAGAGVGSARGGGGGPGTAGGGGDGAGKVLDVRRRSSVALWTAQRWGRSGQWASFIVRMMRARYSMASAAK